jgi:GcrA cell cycle regulator
MSWDEARIADLRRMARERFSAAEIAAELGSTRSAVCGLAFRLGITLHGRSGRANASARRDPAPRPEAPPAAVMTSVAAPEPAPPPAPSPRQPSLQPVISATCKSSPAEDFLAWRRRQPPRPGRSPIPLRRVTQSEISCEPVEEISNLRDHHCRWPIGEPGTSTLRFCGAPRGPDCTGPAHSYCLQHRAENRAAQQPKKLYGSAAGHLAAGDYAASSRDEALQPDLVQQLGDGA